MRTLGMLIVLLCFGFVVTGCDNKKPAAEDPAKSIKDAINKGLDNTKAVIDKNIEKGKAVVDEQMLDAENKFKGGTNKLNDEINKGISTIPELPKTDK